MQSKAQDAPQSGAVNRWLAVFGPVAIAIVYLTQVNREFLLVDDAYIYFRYARNLADGLGLVFNAGVPVEGYSSNVWVLLLAACRWLGFPLETSAAVMGFAAGLGTLAIVWRAGPRFFPGRAPGWYLIAPLFLAVNRTFAAWSTGGLETALFTVVVAASFFRLAVETQEDRSPLSGLLFGLAAVTRPEGPLFVAIGGAILLAGDFRGRGVFNRRALLWWLLACGPYGVQLVLRLWYFGLPFPNPYYVKVLGTWWSMGAWYLAGFAVEHGLFVVGPVVLMALAGRKQAGSRGTAFAFLAIPAPYVLYLCAIGGDHFEYRSLHVALPFFALALQEGAWSIGSHLDSGPRRNALTAPLVAVCLVFWMAIPTFAPTGFGRFLLIRPPDQTRDAPGWPVKVPGFSMWMGALDSVYRHLTAHWVAMRLEDQRYYWQKQKTQAAAMVRAIEAGVVRPTEWIALGPAGIVPFVSMLPTLDLFGLTDPLTATTSRERSSSGHAKIAHERAASIDDVMSRGIDYITITYTADFFIDRDALSSREGRSLLMSVASSYPVYLVPFGRQVFVFLSAVPEAALIERFGARGVELLVVRDGRITPLTQPDRNADRGGFDERLKR